MEVSKRLHQQIGHNLFWNDISSHPLRNLIRETTHTIVEKHISVLLTTQEREHEFFWQEAAQSNLLVFLYLMKCSPPKNDEALQQLELTLEREPNNLNAMMGKLTILENTYHNSEARKMEDKYKLLIEDVEEMERQKTICQGEIAYACSFIGPDLYMSAIDQFEDLLSNSEEWAVCGHTLSPYVIRWQYYLAYTYNRMLNKGHRQKLVEKLGTETNAIFEKISKLYIKVIESDDPFYRGKAMIDLVDTYKKCETSGGKDVTLHFPYDCGADMYVKRAKEAAPNDAHVLERCGRHYRQKACTMEDFEETVAIFDYLLDLYPERHVALHHKGLACRAMWHIAGKYKEARLYSNSSKRGNKKGVKKQKRVMKPTLPSRNRRGPAEVPRQTRKPDFFDVLRTSNPSANKDDECAKFLHEAKKCFEEAKRITKGTCSPYIVDLARCYISLGNNADAKEEFEKGSHLLLSGKINDNDAAYLHEQWALMRHSVVEQDDNATRNEHLADTADLYRKAILFAVRARERSRMAFYKLRDLLGELKDKAGNEVLELEYQVLWNSTENFSDRRQMLVEALENDSDTQRIAWEMIELLNERRHKRDAATAFVYLTALHEASQLDVTDAPEGHVRRQRLLDVVWRLASEEDAHGRAFGDVFRWIVDGSQYISDLGFSRPYTDKPLIAKREMSLCILAPKYNTPGVDEVNRILELCGIEAGKAYCDGNCDILGGCSIPDGLCEVVASSQSVVVVEDSTDTENWNAVCLVLDKLMPLKKVNVCLVAVEDVDCCKTESQYVSRWSRVTIGHGRNDLELAHTLLTTLLCKHLKQYVECCQQSTSA